ncbi:MAG TPA: hypothetical protein VLD58_06530, partial [Gemmatimonadales bacterium]|nr:hypothetical protein [Gemmatimonadales bacterium]
MAIVFSPGPGSGTVSPSSNLTDAGGRAATKWTLGSTGGQAAVTASGGGFVAQFLGAANFKYMAVSAGAKHSCGLDEGGVAYCWGYNGDGQLGIGVAPLGSGPVFAYPQPTASIGDLTFSQLAGGAYHTCGLTLSGVGHCWGVNVDGRLGTGNFTPVNAPTQVLVNRAFAGMSAGQAHSCALDLSNHAACWGRNVDAQLGFGYTAVPPQRIAPDSVAINVPVLILSGQLFSQIASGGVHNCALELFTAAAWCWGNQVNGQLGNGVSGAAGALPSVGTVPVAGGMAFSAITAGDLHTCAIDLAGAAWCWGSDASGQLGDNPAALPGPIQNVPVPVSGGKTFKAISAGRSHTCA